MIMWGLRLACWGTHVRTEEKILKARKTLNMATAMGIKKGGLNMSVCNLIYWTVVIPTLCFGCEMWVIKRNDIEQLQAFQRYAARRLQRFHPRSLNVTCFVSLGWMDIITYIKARQVLFLRSIFVMEEYLPIRTILSERIRGFDADSANMYDSPLINILGVCMDFEVMDEITQMERGRIYSKEKWKEYVWGKAWGIENSRWDVIKEGNRYLEIVNLTVSKPEYSVWWCISDMDRRFLLQCEVMVQLVCHTSKLKDDDCKLKSRPIGERMCLACDLASPEDAIHMVAQCPAQTENRTQMYNQMRGLHPQYSDLVDLGVLFGGKIPDIPDNVMLDFWLIASTYIEKMYRCVLKERKQLVV